MKLSGEVHTDDVSLRNAAVQSCRVIREDPDLFLWELCPALIPPHRVLAL